MKNLFIVVCQTEPVTVQKQDGSSIQKSTLVLREIGGRYENTYVCTLMGNQARYHPDDLVYAVLRFSSHEYQGNHYQDVTLQEIIAITR